MRIRLAPPHPPVAAAAMIALERAPIRRLPRNLVAAVGGEENIKQVALAALLAAHASRGSTRGTPPAGCGWHSHPFGRRPRSVPEVDPTSTNHGKTSTAPPRPTTGAMPPPSLQCFERSVIVTRMPGEKGLFCKRLGQGRAKGTKQQPNGNLFMTGLGSAAQPGACPSANHSAWPLGSSGLGSA